MSNELESTRLQMFGRAVLRIMADHEDWGADTMEAIQSEAARLDLVEADETGRMVPTVPTLT